MINTRNEIIISDYFFRKFLQNYQIDFRTDYGYSYKLNCPYVPKEKRKNFGERIKINNISQ